MSAACRGLPAGRRRGVRLRWAAPEGLNGRWAGLVVGLPSGTWLCGRQGGHGGTSKEQPVKSYSDLTPTAPVGKVPFSTCQFREGATGPPCSPRLC